MPCVCNVVLDLKTKEKLYRDSKKSIDLGTNVTYTGKAHTPMR